MSLIRYNQLDQALDSFQKKANSPSMFLIYGDSYLIKQCVQKLSEFLLGKDKKEFSLETLEGGTVSMGDIIEAISTFSFFFSKKIIVVKNTPLFQPHPGNSEPGISSTDLEHFITFLESGGLPPRHCLIMTAKDIDKRRKLYKTLEENGLVIDCSIAEGVRKTDQDEQEKILQAVSEQILSKSGKIIAGQAFHLLVELTGVDLERFAGNLEKLIVFSGTRNKITPEDVHAVITRDKKDPVFKLTNAFMDKNIKETLFYLDSMFNEGVHPLQILKLFENQIRKLIIVKFGVGKISSNNKKTNFKNFNLFKQTILPEILLLDNGIKAQLESWKEALDEKGAKEKTNPSNDLLLASNPQNTYPVFQIFQKSENFSLRELQYALIFLSDLDYRLKSSSFDAKTVFESFIIRACSKGGFVYANENQNRRHYF